VEKDTRVMIFCYLACFSLIA